MSTVRCGDKAQPSLLADYFSWSVLSSPGQMWERAPMVSLAFVLDTKLELQEFPSRWGLPPWEGGVI